MVKGHARLCTQEQIQVFARSSANLVASIERSDGICQRCRGWLDNANVRLRQGVICRSGTGFAS